MTGDSVTRFFITFWWIKNSTRLLFIRLGWGVGNDTGGRSVSDRHPKKLGHRQDQFLRRRNIVHIAVTPKQTFLAVKKFRFSIIFYYTQSRLRYLIFFQMASNKLNFNNINSQILPERSQNVEFQKVCEKINKLSTLKKLKL